MRQTGFLICHVSSWPTNVLSLTTLKSSVCFNFTSPCPMTCGSCEVYNKCARAAFSTPVTCHRPLYILSCTWQLHSLIWMRSPSGFPKEESVSLKPLHFGKRTPSFTPCQLTDASRAPVISKPTYVHLQILPINFKHFKSGFEELKLPSKAAYTLPPDTVRCEHVLPTKKTGWYNQRQALVPECQPQSTSPSPPVSFTPY